MYFTMNIMIIVVHVCLLTYSLMNSGPLPSALLTAYQNGSVDITVFLLSGLGHVQMETPPQSPRSTKRFSHID
jgi:hypothetical protein